MGIKTNEDWLRALTAAGAEQEEALIKGFAPEISSYFPDVFGEEPG
jgi:hypothetical protein